MAEAVSEVTSNEVEKSDIKLYSVADAGKWIVTNIQQRRVERWILFLKERDGVEVPREPHAHVEAALTFLKTIWVDPGAKQQLFITNMLVSLPVAHYVFYKASGGVIIEIDLQTYSEEVVTKAREELKAVFTLVSPVITEQAQMVWNPKSVTGARDSPVRFDVLSFVKAVEAVNVKAKEAATLRRCFYRAG